MGTNRKLWKGKYTGCKRAEQALQESEDRYRAVFDNSIDAIFITSPDGTIHAANPAACQMFRMTEEEIIRAGRNGTVDTSDPRLKSMLEERAKAGRFKGELDHRRKDGTIFTGEITSSFFKDKNGIVKTVIIIRDVTERKKAEEALQKSEERYRMLFTNMTEGFVLAEMIYDRDGKPYDYRYLEINPAYELNTGVKREQALGKSALEVFSKVNPIMIKKFGEVALSGKSTHFEVFSQAMDRYFEVYAFSPEKGKLAAIFRDITDRKQLEEQTRRQAEEMKTIMDVAPVAIMIGHDPQGHNITGNRMANEFFESEVGENISASVTKTRRFFCKGHELTAYELPIQQAALKDIDVRDVELNALLPSGNHRVVTVSASPLHDANGHVRGSVGAFIDITERKEAEAKLKEEHDNLEKLVKERTTQLEKAYNSLKESEKGLAEAQKMAHIGNWEWDIAADKAYWSEEMYRIFRRDPQKSAPSYNEYSNYIHPDDRDIFYNVTRKAEKRKPYSIDYRVVLDNGEERTVHMHSEIIFDENNNSIRVKGIVQDITERKLAQQKIQESEERYRSFIENFKGIAFEADENFIPVFLHGTVEEITGYSEEEFMSRQPWKEIIHPEDLPLIYLEEEQVRNSPYKASGEIDYRIIRKDGKIKWVHEIYQKIPGNKRNPDKYQGVIYDVTERKETEETLVKMEKVRIKEIHHRIKNNLQVISSLLDLQAEAFSHIEVCKTPEVVEAFMESQSRVISMALIHEELYRGDKIDTLDFAAYLQKLTADLFSSYNLGNKDIGLKLDLEQVYLGMDTAIPLGIIVNELVSNSFKHAFPAGKTGEIQINLRRTETSTARNAIFGQDENCMEKNSFRYILEVSDNGKGIPEEICTEKADSLGLQLVNILVEQIDGCIELKRDQGTKFTIWFNDVEI